MKKAITLMIAAALLASMCACSNSTTENKTDDTTVQSSDSTAKTTEKASSESGDTTATASDDTGSSQEEGGDESSAEAPETKEDGVIYDDDIYEELKRISEGGSDAGLWPADSLPSGIPAFEAYSNMDPVNYQKSGAQELWGLGFDTTAEEIDSYYNLLKENGFRQSSKVTSFWGNGEVVLDMETENNGDGIIWLSIDVYKSAAIEFPENLKGKFPEFKTDSSVWYWTSDSNTLEVAYACGTDFKADLNTYKEALKNDGFTVEDAVAKKEIDGKTYTVDYPDGQYEDTITYSCNG